MQKRNLTDEEYEALTKDMQAVLEKHNCELGVKSSIEILKWIDDGNESKTEEIPKIDEEASGVR